MTKCLVPLIALSAGLILAACGPAARITPGPTRAVSPPAKMDMSLTGSGAVPRTLLTYDDLTTGTSIAPVDEQAFALPDQAAMPAVDFEGRLQLLPGTADGGHRIVTDMLGSKGDPAFLRLPEIDIQFVQDGSYLIPVTQGLVISGDRAWNYILGPGRIWSENGDHGYARASFPFTLVERNQNCTHNGVMTFLFDGERVSQVRYQVTQETCLYFKFDLWGQAQASYTPGKLPQAAALRAAYEAELAQRLPTRPIAALARDYPASGFNPASLTSGVSPEGMTLYGLLIDGTNYVSDCRTRYGSYAYCSEMRVPSYSTAKSAFASLALMRLGQKYGRGVYDLPIRDYVPEAAASAGDWSVVTFNDALDMATGNYLSPGFEADENGQTMSAFLEAESFADKIRLAFAFPYGSPPGRNWVYHTSDTFILTRAMNSYLIRQEGPGADIFDLMREEVYRPLGLSAGFMTTLRTDNSPTGAPLGGYGLFWTADDVVKVARLLNDLDGRIDGKQVLEAGMLAAALQRNPQDRGLDTTGMPVFKYKDAFWAREWTPEEDSQYRCSFWTPFMSGFGGITVLLMPNGSVYYYFSDNNEFAWFSAVTESNKLKPMCP